MIFGLLLHLTVWFDGVPLDCLIDTGSPYTILSQGTAARLGTMVPVSGETVEFRGIGGATTLGHFYQVSNVGTDDIGWPVAFPVVVPNGAMVGMSCLVGTDLLGQQPLLIDIQRQVLRAAFP